MVSIRHFWTPYSVSKTLFDGVQRPPGFFWDPISSTRGLACGCVQEPRGRSAHSTNRLCPLSCTARSSEGRSRNCLPRPRHRPKSQTRKPPQTPRAEATRVRAGETERQPCGLQSGGLRRGRELGGAAVPLPPRPGGEPRADGRGRHRAGRRGGQEGAPTAARGSEFTWT